MDSIVKFAQDNKKEINKHVKKYLPEFEKMLLLHGMQYLMDWVYNSIDEINERSGINDAITCSKGCSMCCNGKIVVSSFEASYITSYITQFNIDVNLELLTIQNSVKNIDDLKLYKKKCTLLDTKGNCKIYPIRPVICRLYNSTDKPELCNFETYKDPTQTARTTLSFAFMVILTKMDAKRNHIKGSNNYYELHKALFYVLIEKIDNGR